MYYFNCCVIQPNVEYISSSVVKLIRVVQEKCVALAWQRDVTQQQQQQQHETNWILTNDVCCVCSALWSVYTVRRCTVLHHATRTRAAHPFTGPAHSKTTPTRALSSITRTIIEIITHGAAGWVIESVTFHQRQHTQSTVGQA